MGYAIKIYDSGLLVETVYADSKRSAQAIARAQSRRFGELGTAVVTWGERWEKYRSGVLVPHSDLMGKP